MSILEQIRALEVLAAIDAELKGLDDQLLAERSALESLTGQLRKIESQIEETNIALAATEKIRSDLAIELRSTNAQIAASREKLARSRTERESNAAQREIEELRRILKDREGEVSKLTADVDGIRSRLAGYEAERNRINTDLGSSEGPHRTQLGGIEETRALKASEREAAVAGLPPAFYRKYETIRQKRGFAVSKTTDGTCRACHIALSPQVFLKLQQEPSIVQCPSCNRFVYYAPPARATASP